MAEQYQDEDEDKKKKPSAVLVNAPARMADMFAGKGTLAEKLMKIRKAKELGKARGMSDDEDE